MAVAFRSELPLWSGLALGLSGGFTLALGFLHFFLPRLLGYEQVILRGNGPLKPFRLGPLAHATRRTDLMGLVWVMNHHASFTLVSIGLVDLLAGAWLAQPPGRWLSLWIAAWWCLRAATQFYLGRRPGTWWFAAGFLCLALVHLGVARG